MAQSGNPDKADYSQCSLKEKNGEMAHQVKDQLESINADCEAYLKTHSPFCITQNFAYVVWHLTTYTFYRI